MVNRALVKISKSDEINSLLGEYKNEMMLPVRQPDFPHKTDCIENENHRNPPLGKRVPVTPTQKGITIKH